jgi:predicted kinase
VAALARETAVRCDAVWLKAPLDERLARIAHRTPDASDANAAVVRKQEQYDLGAINWPVVTAEGSPESLAEACRKSLEAN